MGSKKEKDNIKTANEIVKLKLVIIFSMAMALILGIIDIYLIIRSGSFIAIAVFGLLMVAAVFFGINGIIDLNMKTKEIDHKDYEELYKAQKASYLVIRQSFDELDERLKNIEQSSSLPAEEIISAQKAVAKVTISRSKENTDALMNSNDELINQLFSFEEKLNNNNEALIRQQQELLNQTRDQLMAENALLKQQLASLANQISEGIVTRIETPIASQTILSEDSDELFDSTEIIEDNSLFEPTVSLEDAFSDEEEMPVIDEELQAIIDGLEVESEAVDEVALESIIEEVTEQVSAEPAIEEVAEEAVAEETKEEAPAFTPSEDPNAKMSEDDIAALIASMGAEDTASEPISEEIVEEVASEPVIEEVAEEAPAFIPSEDPNAKMSEDDIAALIASMGAVDSATNESVEEPIIDNIPEEAEEEPLVETETVEIPDVGVDLSDPNRVMSPEEIEKLFANL